MTTLLRLTSRIMSTRHLGRSSYFDIPPGASFSWAFVVDASSLKIFWVSAVANDNPITRDRDELRPVDEYEPCDIDEWAPLGLFPLDGAHFALLVQRRAIPCTR